MVFKTLTLGFVIAAFLIVSTKVSAFTLAGTFPSDSGASTITVPEDGLTIKAGMSISKFSIEGNNDVQVECLEGNNYVSPVIGIGYLATKWFSHRLFYLMQIKLYEFENTGSIRTNVNYWTNKIVSDYDTIYYHAAAQYVLLPSLNIGYKVINRASSKLLLSGGVSSYIMKNPYFIHNPESWTNRLNKVVYTANLAIDYYFSDWVILWGMYNLPATIDKEDYFVGSHSNLQFGIGVRF
jgi:hypothetical protein